MKQSPKLGHETMMTRSRFERFAAVTALSIALVALAPFAWAEPVEASRAKVELASIVLPDGRGRECWARYSTSGGQPRNGLIEEVAFRVPCPEHVTPSFMETLQRALMARGYHDGPVTGRADQATRAAVQAFQRDNGFNSPILTLETAQRLGLAPIEVSRN